MISGGASKEEEEEEEEEEERKNFVSETDPEQTRAGINNPFRGPNPPHSELLRERWR